MSVSSPPKWGAPFENCTSIGTATIDGLEWDLYTYANPKLSHVVAKHRDSTPAATLNACRFKTTDGALPVMQYAFLRAKSLGLLKGLIPDDYNEVEDI